MISLEPDRDVAVRHTRIRAELARRRILHLESLEFCWLLMMLRAVRLSEVEK